MQKPVLLSLSQQLKTLKKSLKSKRQGQIWEHCIQFYRNHQTTITNFDILGLIKIAIKPVKHSILKSCKYISRLSNSYCERSQNKRYIEQLQNKIKQQIKSLKTKIAILQNLFDNYTLALQKVLYQADPHYFKMLFRENYHAHYNNKVLLFQLVNDTNQRRYSAKIIQHQIGCYLKFVCRTSLLYCTSLLCYENEQKVKSCFQAADKSLKTIFQSSHKFAKKELQFQILKLNYITKYPTGNYQIKFRFPLQSFHQIYKNTKKWDHQQIQQYFTLLLRYIFLIFININNSNVVFSPLETDKFDEKNNSNKKIDKTTIFHLLETDIYIYMKEMLTLLRFVNLRNIKFMSIIVGSYQDQIVQMKKWSQFLGKYFDYVWIANFNSHYDQSTTINERKERKQRKEILRQNTIKRKEIKSSELLQSLYTRKTLFLDKDSTSNKNNNSVCYKIYNLFNKVGDVFNYIQQSDSDSDGEMKHQFQQFRRQSIQNLDRTFVKAFIGNQQKREELQLTKIGQKFADLKQQCKQFQKFASSAIQMLTKRKCCAQQYVKLSEVTQNKAQLPDLNSNCYTINQIVAPPTIKPIQLKPSKNKDFITQLIPLSIKVQQQIPQKHHYRQQNINISNKYDKMRKTLLLTSQKQKEV